MDIHETGEAWDAANSEARRYVIKACGLIDEPMGVRAIGQAWADVWPTARHRIMAEDRRRALATWPLIEDPRPAPDTTLA